MAHRSVFLTCKINGGAEPHPTALCCIFTMNKTYTGLDIRKVFAPDGDVSRSLVNFEVRPEQIEMASAVQQTFLKGRHLAVEAGTGVGKSFAYLIPAVDLASNGMGRMLISTFTITLQEQLVNKDIPFLDSCMPQKFNAVLAKGRSNYLCKRRLKFALQRERRLIDDLDSEFDKVQEWADQTKDGSLSDLPFLPKSRTWDRVRSEHGNCRGRKCPYFRDCFYLAARRRLENADIIVANHALLFSDLVLKEQGVSLLPDYKFVILDEAHNTEHVAEDHFGIDISKGQGASNSVISIKCKETGEKIAVYRDANTPPYDLAFITIALALWCGGANPNRLPFLKWENNGPGYDYGKLIVKVFNYPFYYRKEELGTTSDRKTQSYGWHNSTRSKEELL